MPPKGKRAAPVEVANEEDNLSDAQVPASSKVEKGEAAAPKPKAKKPRKDPTNKVPCVVNSCEALRTGGKPCCKLHIRTYDAFRHQADAARQNGDEEMRSAREDMLGDETAMAKELSLFAQENPPDAKYVRKKLMADVGFKRRNLRREVKATIQKRKPMTKTMFKLKCKNKMGMTDTQSEAWFRLFYDDPAVERDRSGPLGEEVLWIPQLQQKEQRTEAK